MRKGVAAGLLLLTACGGDGAASGGTTLTVSVAPEPGAEPQEFTLDCGPPPSGTAPHLAGADAERACAIVEDPAKRARLVDGPDLTRACTQIYGGPQVARVHGTVRGEPVRTEFHRADGCGISDWETFEPLLGPADQPFVVEG